MCRAKGWAVVFVPGSFAESLERVALEGAALDLVFMDLTMPRMDGR